MRKINVFLISSLLFVTSTANAQHDKKEPPPPPPPKVEATKFIPPKIVKDEVIKVQPIMTVKGKRAEEFYKRNADVSQLSRQGNIIYVKKKDGTNEKYDMNKKDEEENFIKKYGESPIPPPPPPPPAGIKS